MVTNIKSIAEDLRYDIIQLKNTYLILGNQDKAARNVMQIIESEEKLVIDSLQFILDFNYQAATPLIAERSNTWNYLNSSGVISEFPDAELKKMLQDYHNAFNDMERNFNNTGIPPRIEHRKLKYELFSDTEHRKFFPTQTPIPPGAEVYVSIFTDKRWLPILRFIGSTAGHFEKGFQSIESKAQTIIDHIEQNYK